MKTKNRYVRAFTETFWTFRYYIFRYLLKPEEMFELKNLSRRFGAATLPTKSNLIVSYVFSFKKFKEIHSFGSCWLSNCFGNKLWKDFGARDDLGHGSLLTRGISWMNLPLELSSCHGWKNSTKLNIVGIKNFAHLFESMGKVQI